MLSRGGLLKKLTDVRFSILWDRVICVFDRTHLAQANACVCKDRRRHKSLLVSISGSSERVLSTASGTAQVPRRETDSYRIHRDRESHKGGQTSLDNSRPPRIRRRGFGVIRPLKGLIVSS